MRVVCAVASLISLLCIATSAARAGAAGDDDFLPNVTLAVNRWLAVQTPSGLLPYGYDFLRDKALEPDKVSAANLTRQAYTASVLAGYYAATGDGRLRPAVRRYLRALDGYSRPIGKSRLQRLVEESGLLAVPVGRYKLRTALRRLGLLYRATGPGEVLSPSADYSQAYTGSVALALLAELRYFQASGDDGFARARAAWVEGLRAVWIPGDGFREYPTSIDTTPYFDGEAWLALAQYHRAFPQDTRTSGFLDEVDEVLLEQYGRTRHPDFFHWGAMAAAARYADTGQPRFLAFIEGQTQDFLSRPGGAGDNQCASAEGMADALGALRRAGAGDSALARRAHRWLAAAMQTAQRLQIRRGQTGITLPHARILAPRLRRFSGAFRSSLYAADTQVDLTAHCVSAMLKVMRLEGRPLAPPGGGAITTR